VKATRIALWWTLDVERTALPATLKSAKRTTDHVERITALGNGQVPAAALLAWHWLNSALAQ
jgi:hypothetical protein